ncbi:MAG: outer membrane beta-barrel protein [Alphaproteobacteria bacterium]|nr:outer membrane beta-barrel protein [Alphaproteobacteria bacterium]
MKAKGILLATVAGVSIAAASQSSAHHQGWYVGLEAGVNWIDDTSVLFERTRFTAVEIESESARSSWWNGNSSGSLEFDTGWAGFATVGYGFEKNWRVELELGYRDNDATLTREGRYCGGEELSLAARGFCGTRTYDGDMTEYTAMINVIYDVPLTEKLDLNIGLGAGVDYVQLDLSRNGRTLTDESDTRFAFQAIAGLTYQITKRLDLSLTYRYLNVSEPSFEARYKTLELDDLEKHTVTVGLRYDLYEDEAPLPPLPPQPPLPPAGPQQFIIYFGFDKCNITPEADGVLNEAAAAAKTQGSVKIKIVGHTDTMGSNDYNQRLSECRSDAAKSNLVGKGLSAGSISTSGRGEGELMVKTDDSVKEPQNRRATIDLNN